MLNHHKEGYRTNQDLVDFSDFMRIEPDSNTYILDLRWKQLTTTELFNLSLQIHSKSKPITSLDLNQTKIGIILSDISLSLSFPLHL